MSFRTLLLEDRGAVRRININRPEKLNALNRETISDLHVAFGERRNAVFDDGKELDSQDVKYSFDMQANPPPPGSTKVYYPKIASIDLPDKYTVKLNMTASDPTVAGYLAWARYSPSRRRSGTATTRPARRHGTSIR